MSNDVADSVGLVDILPHTLVATVTGARPAHCQMASNFDAHTLIWQVRSERWRYQHNSSSAPPNSVPSISRDSLLLTSCPFSSQQCHGA